MSGLVTNTLKFYYYYVQYRIWGQVSSVTVYLHQKYYPTDSVPNISDEIISETTRNISRYATKKAHTCRVRYESIGERIVDNG